MIKCPICKCEIDDDSKFCDQCGKEIFYCPECKEPKKGTTCPRCGEDLVSAKIYFSNQLVSKHQTQSTTPREDQRPSKDDTSPVQTAQRPSISVDVLTPQVNNSGTVIAQLAPPSLSIIGNSWCLPIKEGKFGRTGGIYREFSTDNFISGNHGEFRINGNQWEVKDSGSTNGTFLNGEKLTPGQWYSINKGDSLKIATTHFVIN